MNKKILIKISGELFKSNREALDSEKVLAVAEEIKKAKRDDYDIGIVFGAGNIYRGRNVKEQGLDMSLAHYTGMMATIVNALAFRNALSSLQINCRIVSKIGFPDVFGSSNPLDIQKYFQLGEVLIFAGGTGNPYVTTDTCAVVRALEMRADFILKGTGVRGVYDADPRKNPVAVKFKEMDYATFLSMKESTIFDKTAIVMAYENRLPIYIFKWDKGSLRKAIKLKAGGTLIK